MNMLIPDNAEPHTWEPAPSDLIRVSNSKVLVYNGVNFEPWMSASLARSINQKLASLIPALVWTSSVRHRDGPDDQAVALLALTVQICPQQLRWTG